MRIAAFIRLFTLLVGAATLLGCQKDDPSDTQAPTTTLVRFVVGSMTVSPSSSAIMVSKAEIALRGTFRFADNTSVASYTLIMEPTFATTNPADDGLRFTLNGDISAAGSAPAELEINLGTTNNMMTTGVFRLRATCRDAAGNVSAEAVQLFSVM